MNEIEKTLIEIGRAVVIHYEPRNEGSEWYVGFQPDGDEMPVHEHFADLAEGLLWLSRNGKYLQDRR